MRSGRKNKYGNKKTLVDGILFDSKLESKRWCELILLQRAGEISELDRQTKFILEINNVRIGTYVADFTYMENGARVVEDTKSPPTAKKPDYIMKKRLMLALAGIEIVEVFA